MKLSQWNKNGKKLLSWELFDDKLPNYRQHSQAAWGKGQGMWGKYAPKTSPMQYRKEVK